MRFEYRLVAFTAFAAIGIVAWVNHAGGQSKNNDVASLVESIRQKHRVPALGVAIVTSRGVVVSAVTGTRKAGTDVAATIDDQWHLGSDTKAMTAVIIATFVERGKITWETTLGEVFTELASGFPLEFRAITVTQLLSHYAGLPANLAWRQIARSGAALPEQRLQALKIASTTKLTSQPGTRYEYSNLGYTLAGAIAERVGGKSWEELMSEIIFKPLDMASCGFGGVGTPGKIDQPWPHTANGEPMASNGTAIDNAPVVGPAGTVHCSIADWSKFVADQLRGARGPGTLLKAETYKTLHTPRLGNYTSGWEVTTRAWAGGRMLQHSGSNSMNFCTLWVAPLRDIAVLAVTNQGADAGEKAVNEAVEAMLRLQEKR